MNRTATRARGIRLLTVAAAFGMLSFVPGAASAQNAPQAGGGAQTGCIRDASPTGPNGRLIPAAQCGAINFRLFVPEQCATSSCGIIVDLPGVTLTAAITDRQTQLSQRGPAAGFIVAEATASGAVLGLPAFDGNAPRNVIAFLEEAVRELNVDRNKIHLQGFSQGAGVSLNVLCQRSDLIASASVIAPAGGGPADCFRNGPPGNVQALMFTQSSQDQLVAPARTQQTVNRIIAGMGLTQASGTMIASAARGAVIRRFMNPQGKILQVFTHNDGGATVGNGHCFPGSFEGPQPGAANINNGNPVGSVVQLVGRLLTTGQDPNQIVSSLQFGCNDQDQLRIGQLNIDFFMMNPRRP
jgi:hypothetical protein